MSPDVCGLAIPGSARFRRVGDAIPAMVEETTDGFCAHWLARLERDDGAVAFWHPPEEAPWLSSLAERAAALFRWGFGSGGERAVRELFLSGEVRLAPEPDRLAALRREMREVHRTAGLSRVTGAAACLAWQGMAGRLPLPPVLAAISEAVDPGPGLLALWTASPFEEEKRLRWEGRRRLAAWLKHHRGQTRLYLTRRLWSVAAGLGRAGVAAPDRGRPAPSERANSPARVSGLLREAMNAG